MSEASERWVLLDGPLSSNHIPSILGCVVAYPRQPIKEYAPNDEPSKDPNLKPIVTTELIPDLHDKPITFTDLQAIKQCAKEGQARLKVASILDAKATTRADNFVRYAANQVVRYDMPNPKLKLQRLWENAQYREAVRRMFDDNAETARDGLPMVTGVLTCRRLSVVRTNSKSWGGWVKARLPLVEALGDYVGFLGAANPEVGGGGGRSSGDSLSMHLDEEVVFALAYDHVSLKQEIDERKGIHMSRIMHSSKKPVKPAGEGESKGPQVKLGSQVRGDIGYFGEEEESEVGSESEVITCELKDDAFITGTAVIDFEFEGLAGNTPTVVEVAGEVGEVEHFPNGGSLH